MDCVYLRRLILHVSSIVHRYVHCLSVCHSFLINIFRRFYVFISDLNETQKQYQSVALKFAKEEIAPKAAYHDKTGEVLFDNHIVLI